MTMGDRIAILDGGQLQQVATPLQCYHEPANQFVAGFIGEPSMNFFDVTREGDALVAEVFEFPLSPAIQQSLADTGTDQFVLGVRPEAVELVAEAVHDYDYETVVDVVEPMGDENTVYLEFEGTAEALVATTSGMLRIREGEHAVARIPDDAVHVFDATTGEALHNRDVSQEEPADLAIE
jgi:multiple sugar transport system ATP-binding protein